MTTAPLRVILDCDTANEIDDQFAIAYALGSPALDVRGVISVHDTYIHGAASVEMYQQEAERVVQLSGAAGRVPCLRGAVAPMEDRRTPVRSEGLDFLIAEAQEAPLTIIATGPITDVASLLLVAPELRERLHIVWLGGFAHREVFRRYRLAELNGRADIAAWRILMESEVSLLQLPGWPGVVKLSVEWRTFSDELRTLNRPVADYLAALTVRWMTEREALMERTITDKVLWDAVNVAALVLPNAVTVEQMPCATLDAAAAHDFDRPGREISVVTDLDAPAILADLRAALLRLPTTV